MVIKIAIRGDKRNLECIKRIRLVKKYEDFNLYDIVDKQGNKLYRECYTQSEVERMMM